MTFQKERPTQTQIKQSVEWQASEVVHATEGTVASDDLQAIYLSRFLQADQEHMDRYGPDRGLMQVTQTLRGKFLKQHAQTLWAIATITNPHEQLDAYGRALAAVERELLDLGVVAGEAQEVVKKANQLWDGCTVSVTRKGELNDEIPF